MMQDWQPMMVSGMGWTMGFGSLLIIILLLLGIAALTGHHSNERHAG
jgi:hypothetical protein